jgi:hypothetical protein
VLHVSHKMHSRVGGPCAACMVALHGCSQDRVFDREVRARLYDCNLYKRAASNIDIIRVFPGISRV